MPTYLAFWPGCIRTGSVCLLFSLLLFLNACKREAISTQNDNDYAPIEMGRYWVYEIQDERYSLSDSPVMSTYYLKETIAEQVSATQGGKTYKLIRYKRNRLSDAWKADSIWTIQQWPDKLIRTENNTAFVKLTFPIASNSAWNQNEYNALPASVYRYNQIGESYDKYANTVQVISKQNDSTAISLNRQFMVYGYQTGLIYKESTALAYCQSSPSCIGKGQIASGYRQRWELLESGKE
ncbi:hypothetical protein GO730_27085 [Spirosoma sp. HMF3257]|uniref:Uncharacterized protein n=1 Tax=Spirosoma telluris TaxID=2183553 RepID=A0A327NSJ2_9BACT|nr:hypothetical protein [Spirosoma telluris]RAI76916.1 hypothetical protein HMF3257_27010 [Spirosoma telluris]